MIPIPKGGDDMHEKTKLTKEETSLLILALHKAEAMERSIGTPKSKERAQAFADLRKKLNK